MTCFAAVYFPKSTLKRIRDVITLKMVNDLLVKNVLKCFAPETCK